MNEEEKEVSIKDLKQEGEIALFEGKPYNGVCVDYYANGNKQMYFYDSPYSSLKIYKMFSDNGSILNEITDVEGVRISKRYDIFGELQSENFFLNN